MHSEQEEQDLIRDGVRDTVRQVYRQLIDGLQLGASNATTLVETLTAHELIARTDPSLRASATKNLDIHVRKILSPDQYRAYRTYRQNIGLEEA